MKLQNFIQAGLKTQIRLWALFSKQRAGNKAFKIFCTPFGKTNYATTAVLQTAETLQLTCNGTPLRGYRWNKGASKKLLIAHGFRSHTQRFDHLIPPLIKRGYEIIAFDAPAHGLSGGKQINAIDYTDTIQVVTGVYGPFDAYLAHSFGGLAVVLSVAAQPQNENKKIVLFAPATDAQALANTFLKAMAVTDPFIQKHFYNNVTRLSDGKALNWFSMERCLPLIKSQILWIQDAADPVIPVQEAVAIRKRQHPNIEFVFTDGLGHSGIYRDAALLNKVYAFLATETQNH
ncbi:MAG: alpha/beta fold hydrolase [Niabella sp.]|nr:alpha/beta fold hydrolase [Niabella sp.]